MNFKPGDVVQLKSGGPHMTIASVNGDTIIGIWIEKNKTFREPFPFIVLDKVEYGGF